MLSVQYNENNSGHWIKNDSSGSDLFTLSEATFTFINKTSVKIRYVKFLLPQIVNAIGWIFLLPLRIVLLLVLVPIYLVISIIFRIYFEKQYRKLQLAMKDLDSFISKQSTAVLTSEHSEVRRLLNNLVPQLEKLEGEPIMQPVLAKMINELKTVELKFRLAAYPEYNNECILTYDEIRELTELTDLSF